MVYKPFKGAINRHLQGDEDEWIHDGVDGRDGEGEKVSEQTSLQRVTGSLKVCTMVLGMSYMWVDWAVIVASGIFSGQTSDVVQK